MNSTEHLIPTHGGGGQHSLSQIVNQIQFIVNFLSVINRPLGQVGPPSAALFSLKCLCNA